MTLAKQLKKSGVKALKHGPIWSGPTSKDDTGGITFSLLSKFLCDRERFRLLVVEGLKPQPSFNHRLEYGNMWHICEEALAAGQHKGNKIDQWKPLTDYCKQLAMDYRLQGEQVNHWYQVCKAQFPVYVNYWAKQKGDKQRTSIAQEYVFKVPYKLPSGRTVYLRGKWDALDHVGTKANGRLWLQENKAKGDIDELKLTTQLRFDLQSMMYYLVLYHYYENAKAGDELFPFDPGTPAGIRYNVIRRPLSGGKHSIRQKQNESAEEFYARLGGLIAEEPDHYFARWNVEVSRSDLEHFKVHFFIPAMEQLCDWWEYMRQCNYDPWSERGRLGYCVNENTNDDGPYYVHLHYRFPNGVYNPVLETNSSELDEYLTSGSMLGLIKTERLFKELSDV